MHPYGMVVFPDDNSAEPLRTYTLRTRLTGLGQAGETEFGTSRLVMESKDINNFGNESVQQAFSNRGSGLFITITTDPASIIPACTLFVYGNAVSNRTTTDIISSRTYDALGRVIGLTDGRGNTTTRAYDAAGRVSSSTDATGATTAYGYDVLGRQIAVTNALGLVTTTAYDLDGNVVSQRGAQYPVDYTYDDYGRMSTMSTYRDEALAHPDVTTWLYDEATGLMTNKIYVDGKGPTCDYTPDGQLSRRIWARGVITDYTYDFQGRLVAKTYSDSTPNVSLVYDRLGHTLSAICESVSTNLYAYNRLGQLTNEVQNGTSIARSYDALGRPTGYALGSGGALGSPAVAGTEVEYAYDTLGRFSSVASGTNIFIYSYLPGSDLVSGMTANTDHAWERIYEPDRDLIATVHNRYGDRTISRFDYTNDEIGRRIARVDSGEAFEQSAFERYAYNGRSEVVGSQRFYGADAEDFSRPVPGRAFFYGYDSAGNRTNSIETIDGVLETKAYTANALNQYETIQTLSDNDPNPTTNALEYDDDGNMIFDGRFRYSWNAENRMIYAVEAVAPTNRAPTLIDYAYDYQGRMVAKNIAGTNTIARALLWDDYNIIRETDNGIDTYNVWGLDLDGTLQGCGGIGGLLSSLKNKKNTSVIPMQMET